MGFENGEISLDSPTGSYYAGSTIYGKLIFHENDVQRFRGIYVKFKGYCKVHWTTSHTRTVDGERRTYHETHESEEEYVHLKVYLLGSESGEYSLQPGRHELPFQFIIPQNCPSSFEGSKGHIRYELKAVVDRKFKLDHEMTRDVTVIAQLDLNADPYCKEPMVFEFAESYCCCCISSGSSETVIKLPTSGFVPGQVVPIEIGCNTLGSSVSITEISFRIEKTITYNANRNPAIDTESEKFHKTITGPVASDTQRNWTCNLDIPDLPVGSLDTCKFIDIQYNLLIKIVPDGCHEDSEDSRRIVIGNIPLAGFTDHSQNVTQIITGPVTSQPLSNAPSAYPNNTPYPGNVYPGGNPPYPDRNLPYPGSNPPYPGNSPYPGGNMSPGGNPPYPGANPQATSPYPGANPPYPGGNPPATSPYPSANPPYPGGNPPATSPYPGANPSYPGAIPPYPGANPPYPGANPPYPIDNPSQSYPGGISPGTNPPYPTVTPYPPTTQPTQNMAFQTSPNLGLKTGTVGFTVQPPQMPSLPNPPPANPYATASAPPE